jgi:tetratricopeptide (TPR) repeat protein
MMVLMDFPTFSFHHDGVSPSCLTSSFPPFSLNSSYNKAIQLQPDWAFAYNGRGNVRYDSKDLQGALEDYNKAIQLQPNLVFPYNGRGNIKLDRGDNQDAIEDYNMAIQLKSDLAPSHYGRGIARSRLGNRQGAIRDYQEAIRLYESQGNTKLAQEVRVLLGKIQ